MITDKRGPFAAAWRQIMPAIEHLNDRAENSHLPLRRRSGRCRAFDLREACSGSSPSSLDLAERPRLLQGQKFFLLGQRTAKAALHRLDHRALVVVE
jgi:hypothetical protein